MPRGAPPPPLLIRGMKRGDDADMEYYDILCVGGKIASMTCTETYEPTISAELGRLFPDLDLLANMERDDELFVVPGFIDCHAHVLGGGGESGFSTRVPPPVLSQYTTAGVTTVVGLLGTDDLTKTTSGLLAQVYALQEEGLSAYAFTGGYHVPATTLTGDVKSDIVHIPDVLGFGELAISDHRSSGLTFEQFNQLAREVHVAGLMTKKNTTLHCHLGTEPAGLNYIERLITETGVPARVVHPTHCNRNTGLFEEALLLAEMHGLMIDVTPWPHVDDTHGPQASSCIRVAHTRKLLDNITVSSDCGGSIHKWVDNQPVGMDYGRSNSLIKTLSDVVEGGIPLCTALKPFTTNPAKVLGLSQKGSLEVGKDADILILRKDPKSGKLSIRHVIIGGRVMVKDLGGPDEYIVRGTFEQS